MHTRRDSRAARLARTAAVLILAAALLQACSSRAPSSPDNMKPPPGHGPYTGTVADWPLWFPFHSFGAYCFGVASCQISYAGQMHGSDQPRPPITSLERPLREALHAGRGPIRNFPPPAEVEWTTIDGTRLMARVDIADIFADRMVRHTVAREDIMEDSLIPRPGIILVVNDRTINTYMSTWIPLKELQDPANPHSDLHTGLVLVHSKTH
ncbi:MULTISPECIES: hypothetical protein [unclassified Luteimonas]|uniref:hypothetical protein n=1 Tax=unclassified Luteimonas TaxID=2629088 RepID=UPI0018F0A452|nr:MULTISPECIES: hypothetical protein [unclassified Luteimonas]MBJ6980233.1 hypothetical protein [Luteimonas sp. MC1895]MBJ6985289.1 hypothetical protein [Luteimonas sp. MC1750]QQO05446.1 hypothetical protein JGR68_11480 [Luteimonas sp. MC1750]